MVEDSTTFSEWIAFGISKRWCGPPVCATHDGVPSSLWEDEEMFENGTDLCQHIIRMYESPEEAAAVEEAHSPSQWRLGNDLEVVGLVEKYRSSGGGQD